MPLVKAVELYLATKGKSPSFIDLLKNRPRYFTTFIHKTHGETFNLQDLTVEDGRGFIRELMERDVKYSSHPLLESRGRKLAVQYIYSPDL